MDLRAFAEAYVRDFGEAADASYWLGQVEEAAGQEERAVARYWRALELDGGHLRAAEELDARLRVDALARAKKSVEDARALYADYRRILDLAPREPVRVQQLRLRTARGVERAHGGPRLEGDPPPLRADVRGRRAASSDRGARRSGTSSRGACATATRRS